MRCNVRCTLYNIGTVSRASIVVSGQTIPHCVHRHTTIMRRGEYERVELVNGDITSTYCYREKRSMKGGGSETRRRNKSARRV